MKVAKLESKMCNNYMIIKDVAELQEELKLMLGDVEDFEWVADDTITITFQEMSEKEYAALPEFEGW